MVCLFVRHFAIAVMYIERSIRGAKDPHGSFAHSHAALDSIRARYSTIHSLALAYIRTSVLHKRDYKI